MFENPKRSKGKDKTISIRVTVRGDKELWKKFVDKVERKKKETNKTIWRTLEKWINDYLNQP